jgi:predicted nuclease with TOPRIM domain
MASEGEMQCPHCGHAIPELEDLMRLLEKENLLLEEENQALTELVEITKTRNKLAEILESPHVNYVASAIRETFYRPGCEWAQAILDSYNLVEFSSHEKAVEAGYKPCKTCRA